MKRAYDLKKLKVKRHGILPAFQGEETTSGKVRITISLDKDVVDYFKTEAKHAGAFPYQTQINQALKSLINKWHGKVHADIEEFKMQLLQDQDFVQALVKQVHRKHHGD